MDRNKIASDLRQAEDHIRQGEEHIRKQRRLVQHLKDDGHPTGMARELLHTFEELQETHLAGRDVFAAELAMADKEQAQTADDETNTGKPDRDRINTSEEYEVRDWAARLRVSEGELKAAVKKVGSNAQDVAKSLGKSL